MTTFNKPIKLDKFADYESLLKRYFPTIKWEKAEFHAYHPYRMEGYLYPETKNYPIHIDIEVTGDKIVSWKLQWRTETKAKNINLLSEEVKNSILRWMQNEPTHLGWYITQEIIDFGGLDIQVPQQEYPIPEWEEPSKFAKYGISKPDGTKLDKFISKSRRIWKNNDVFQSYDILMTDGTVISGDWNGEQSLVDSLNAINFDGCSEWKNVSSSLWRITND